MNTYQLNAEGYADPTVGAAFANIAKEKRKSIPPAPVSVPPAFLRSDTAGRVVPVKTVKLSNCGITWNKRLSKILKVPGEIILCTYSLVNLPFLTRVFSQRSTGVTIITHERYSDMAKRLKEAHPDLKVYVSPYVHAKLLLADPRLVWVSSENLGHNKNSFDCSIGLESLAAYVHYKAQVDRLLRNASTVEITSCS